MDMYEKKDGDAAVRSHVKLGGGSSRPPTLSLLD